MAIKMITPKGIDVAAQRAAIDNGLLAAVEDARVFFFMTYHNWDEQPDFDVIGPKTLGGNRVVEYSTDDAPYVFVSNGTPAHAIRARNAPFLRFKAGSIPKTKPGRFQSMVGSPGTDWVTKDEVRNPGIEAREFPKHVVERLVVARLMQNEINAAVR